jgi:hypothetical protein
LFLSFLFAFSCLPNLQMFKPACFYGQHNIKTLIIYALPAPLQGKKGSS